MTSITEFDKPALKALRIALDKAVKEVGEEFGINLETGGCRFSSTIATFKLEATVAQDGEFESKQRMEFKRNAQWINGINLDDEFVSGGKRFRVDGWSNKAKRYKILAVELRSGKTYKFACEDVRRNIELEAA